MAAYAGPRSMSAHVGTCCHTGFWQPIPRDMVNRLSIRLYRPHWGSGAADATIPPRASLVLRVPGSYWIDCFMEAERFAQWLNFSWQKVTGTYAFWFLVYWLSFIYYCFLKRQNLCVNRLYFKSCQSLSTLWWFLGTRESFDKAVTVIPLKKNTQLIEGIF